MSFAAVIETLMQFSDSVTPQQIEDSTVETLEDPAVRREVYLFSQEEEDELDMRDIHIVLDALVKVMRGVDLG